MVKVINLEYGFLESRKLISRINLEASQISLGCVKGRGRDWGCRGCGGGCLLNVEVGWGVGVLLLGML